MHRHLSEFVVRIADLAEAEGRVLRTAIARTGLGLSLTIVAAVLALVGCVLLLGALWLGVATVLGPIWASAITGLATLLLAAALLFGASRLAR